ncbi:MAG TPA: hypothetical protein VGW74_10580 [Propionibacteriaceae bacterium]|nr:hypothetical protein [Propionibacteriaceae bacterium]
MAKYRYLVAVEMSGHKHEDVIELDALPSKADLAELLANHVANHVDSWAYRVDDDGNEVHE